MTIPARFYREAWKPAKPVPTTLRIIVPADLTPTTTKDASVVCVPSTRIDPAWRAVAFFDTFAEATAHFETLNPREGRMVARLNNKVDDLAELVLEADPERYRRRLKVHLSDDRLREWDRLMAHEDAFAAPKVSLKLQEVK